MRTAAGLARLKLTCSCTIQLVLVGVLAAAPAAAQETAQYFRQNCASCHTVGGGRLAGPDLKDVGQRQNEDWLISFIMNPQAVLASGDAYAAKLKDEAKGVVMPTIPGMTRERARALLELIAAESQLEKSQFAGITVSMEPFTARDVELGRQIVLGRQRLENGGAACIGCHAVRGTGALGGGRLGPDLSRVYQRLGGDDPRKNLSAWLSAPATPTMQPMFNGRPLTGDEIHGLVAFFEASARAGGEEEPTGLLAFLLLGVLAAFGGLAGMDAIWGGRFRGVRRALVELAARGGKSRGE